ncbi:hypothetical protein QZH41_004887 [Actinostola sp. cb2023]|nr:hypothetical protein QZH41_004887 [Actinostola sp. cb2023]
MFKRYEVRLSSAITKKPKTLSEPSDQEYEPQLDIPNNSSALKKTSQTINPKHIQGRDTYSLAHKTVFVEEFSMVPNKWITRVYQAYGLYGIKIDTTFKDLACDLFIAGLCILAMEPKAVPLNQLVYRAIIPMLCFFNLICPVVMKVTHPVAMAKVVITIFYNVYSIGNLIDEHRRNAEAA